MPKIKNAMSQQQESASELTLHELNQEVRAASGKLLETTGTMHGFMQSLYTSGFREYVDYIGRPWYSFWLNFLLGIGRGLGFVIGATVVVGLVVWIISRILTQLPLVGEFFQSVDQFLSKERLQQIQSASFSDSLDDFFNVFKANVLKSTQEQEVIQALPEAQPPSQ